MTHPRLPRPLEGATPGAPAPGAPAPGAPAPGAPAPGAPAPGAPAPACARWPGDLDGWTHAAASGSDPAPLRAALTESWHRHWRILLGVQGVSSSDAADIRSLCGRVLADIAMVELSIRQRP